MDNEEKELVEQQDKEKMEQLAKEAIKEIKKEEKNETKYEIKAPKKKKKIPKGIFIVIPIIIIGVLCFVFKDNFKPSKKVKKEKKEYVYNLEEIKFDKGSAYTVHDVKNKAFFEIHDNKGKIYLYDENKNLLTKNSVDAYGEDFVIGNNRYFIISKNDKESIIDEKGNTIIDYNYEYIYFNDDVKDKPYFVLTSDKEYTMATITNNKASYGKKYKQYIYSSQKANLSQDCKLGYCPVIIDNELRYVDYKGNLLPKSKDYTLKNAITNNFLKGSETQLNNLIIKTKNNVYFTIIEDGKLGLMDKDGNTIIEPKYYEISYSETLNTFVIISNEKTYVVTEKGKIIADLSDDLEYDDQDPNYRKTADYTSNGIDDRYVQIYDKILDKFYVFDKNYKLINTKYEVEYYMDKFYVSANKKKNDVVSYNIYNYDDKLLMSEIDSIYEEKDKGILYYTICKEQDKCSVYDENLKHIIQNDYYQIDLIKDGLIYVNNKTEYLVFDTNGKKLSTLAPKEGNKKIGYRLYYEDDQDVQLFVYDTDDAKTIFYTLPEKMLVLDKKGQVKKTIINKGRSIYLSDNNTMFTSDGIYDKQWNKKALNIDINKEKFNSCLYEKINNTMYYELFKYETDKDSINDYTLKIYKINKIEKTKDTK